MGWLKSDGYQVVGIEPSKEAVNYGIANSDLTELELLVGDASTFLDKCVSKFDMIIFGHSLYLMDPEDLPNIVANTMRLLNEDGYIVIFDFDSDPQKTRIITEKTYTPIKWSLIHCLRGTLASS